MFSNFGIKRMASFTSLRTAREPGSSPMAAIDEVKTLLNIVDLTASPMRPPNRRNDSSSPIARPVSSTLGTLACVGKMEEAH